LRDNKRVYNAGTRAIREQKVSNLYELKDTYEP